MLINLQKLTLSYCEPLVQINRKIYYRVLYVMPQNPDREYSIDVSTYLGSCILAVCPIGLDSSENEVYHKINYTDLFNGKRVLIRTHKYGSVYIRITKKRPVVISREVKLSVSLSFLEKMREVFGKYEYKHFI